jgi:hypothetical protein
MINLDSSGSGRIALPAGESVMLLQSGEVWEFAVMVAYTDAAAFAAKAATTTLPIVFLSGSKRRQAHGLCLPQMTASLSWKSVCVFASSSIRPLIIRVIAKSMLRRRNSRIRTVAGLTMK